MEFTQSPNHRNWSTAKKNSVRDGANAWGDLERFVKGSPILPATAVIGFFAFVIGATELIESINL